MNKTNCIICGKRLTDNKINHNSIVCSNKCNQARARVFTHYHYQNNKPIYQSYMRNYYDKNKDKLKVDRRNSYIGERSYDRPSKNIVREKLIDIVSHYDIKKILTLESNQFLFSKELPHKKIYVYEYSKREYDKMLKTKPKNVSLFFGDIINFSELDIDVDFVYLDFCSTLTSNIDKIQELKQTIIKSKLFAITVCLRDRTIEEDYQFNLFKTIMDITGINIKPLYAKGYKDSGTPMFTVIFENMSLKNV